MKTRKGQQGQDSRDRTTRTGQPGKSGQDRADTGKDSQLEQEGQGNQDIYLTTFDKIMESA